MAKGGFKSRTANGLIRNNVACAVDCTLRSKAFVSRHHPKTFFRSNFTTSGTAVKLSIRVMVLFMISFYLPENV